MSDTAARATTLPWYHAGLRFSCTRCGNCCGGAPGYVWVSVREIRAIAAYLDLSAAEFERHHTRTAGDRRSLLEHRNGDCEFLERHPDGKAGCRIHPVRPVQCRTWPFWKSNLESPETWKMVGRGCPGVDRGHLHALPVIQQQLYAGASRPL